MVKYCYNQSTDTKDIAVPSIFGGHGIYESTSVFNSTDKNHLVMPPPRGIKR